MNTINTSRGLGTDRVGSLGQLYAVMLKDAKILLEQGDGIGAFNVAARLWDALPFKVSGKVDLIVERKGFWRLWERIMKAERGEKLEELVAIGAVILIDAIEKALNGVIVDE